MNTYRYDEEKRKQWVRDKVMRLKTVKQICREAAVSRATLYNWLDEFEDTVKEISKKDALETESGEKSSRPDLIQRTSHETGERYRMLVAAIAGVDQNLAFSKKLITALVKRFTLTVPQACAIVGIDESAYGYKPRKPEVEDYVVYEALVNLIHEDRTRDFETCYKLLLRQYPDWTRKQIKRVYRDGMVYLERKRSNTRWEKAAKARESVITAPSETVIGTVFAERIQKPGGTWNLGLIQFSSSFDGEMQPCWWLFILDEEHNTPLNAACGAGDVSIEQVLSFLDKAVVENGTPRKLKIPGKSVLTARELTRWVWEHRMTLYTLSLNKPENAVTIAAMEQLAMERLNLNTISSIEEFELAIDNWIAKN
ncbi:MAG TPA: transposase [Flavipsychrobacter sp.]|nr:transposase [Flavipsychrobacter sp.]